MAFSFTYYQNSSLLVLLFAILFSAIHHSSSQQVQVEAAVDPLLSICRTVGSGSSKYVGVDFCLSALRSDNRSRNAKEGYRDFAAIAVDLLTDNVTGTAVKIDRLLQNGGVDAATSIPLRLCQELYIEIVGRLPGCADGVKDGSFKLVQANLRILARDLNKCEAGFVESRVASPLKVDDGNAFRLAKLADALLDHAT